MNIDELIDIVPADVADLRIQAAVAELQALVLAKFPQAIFGPAHRDDSDGIIFIATVDTDDLDEVIDAVMPRMLDMLVDEGLPVYVAPEWPAWRIQQQVREMKQASSPEPVANPFA